MPGLVYAFADLLTPRDCQYCIRNWVPLACPLVNGDNLIIEFDTFVDELILYRMAPYLF